MNQEPRVVNFDVGGTPYKVSRSLLERHPNTMLARMVSDLWQQVDNDMDMNVEESRPLFIERDGGRFKFVLDYMRDGRVFLPIGCHASKESLLLDLQYFGFQGVSSDAVQITQGGLWESESLIRDIEHA